MLRIKVTDCPAGPALDAAVANALGHLVAHQPDFGRWFIASDADALQEGLSHGEFWEDITSPERIRYCSTMPEYSSRIRAAWELWQKNEGYGWLDFYDHLRALCTHHFDGTSIDSIEHEYGVSEYDVMASINPLTITRAFLLAHGVTEVEVPNELERGTGET